MHLQYENSWRGKISKASCLHTYKIFVWKKFFKWKILHSLNIKIAKCKSCQIKTSCNPFINCWKLIIFCEVLVFLFTKFYLILKTCYLSVQFCFSKPQRSWWWCIDRILWSDASEHEILWPQGRNVIQNSLDFSFYDEYEYLWWWEKNCQQPWNQNHHSAI